MRSPESASTNVGKLLDRGLRQSDALSQSQLAERCGVHKSYIVKLRNGAIRHPNGEVLARLAGVLDQDVQDYRLAILLDSGMLPSWQRLWQAQVAFEYGVKLNADDLETIQSYARVLVRLRADKTPPATLGGDI